MLLTVVRAKAASMHALVMYHNRLNGAASFQVAMTPTRVSTPAVGGSNGAVSPRAATDVHHA